METFLQPSVMPDVHQGTDRQDQCDTLTVLGFCCLPQQLKIFGIPTHILKTNKTKQNKTTPTKL